MVKVLTKRTVRTKFEDFEIVNGVPVFFGSKLRVVTKITDMLRWKGYGTAFRLMSVGRVHGKLPVAMSLSDAERFFDDFELDTKFSRPDFKKLRKFFGSLNLTSVATSIYSRSRNRSLRLKAYAFWLFDILPPGCRDGINPNKPAIEVAKLKDYVNPGQLVLPYAFFVDMRPAFYPPKAFKFKDETLSGTLVRIHIGLRERFGREYGFLSSAEEIMEMEPLKRDTYLLMTRVLFPR